MRILLLCCIMLIGPITIAQNNYSNFNQQSERLKVLQKKHPQSTKLTSLGKTAGNKEIWMLTIGNGSFETKPAIAIVGGIEGNNLLGSELPIAFAEKLLSNNSDSIKTLLERTTFYIFPNMSPDAMETYFSAVQYEQTGNMVPTDDDRDGKTDEDGYEDLDGDGKITMMRILSPIGNYRVNPEDNRSIIKADPGKGEVGTFLIFTEGRDNDKDGLFNEDGKGGVSFNKNFSFRHPSFTPGAGEFAVSEIENRVLLDKLYELFNIYAVVSFSTTNNLSSPVTFNAASTTPRIITGYLEEDAKANAMVSDLYIKSTSLKDAPKYTSPGGDFASWAYFHYGRFSYSSPGWFIPKPKLDTSKKEKPLAISDSVANYMRWSSSRPDKGSFTPWKKIQHPDFPNQTVEVGGVAPFVLINPPYDLVPELVVKHTDFLIKLAAMQPRLAIENVRTEKLGNNLTRITVTVMNAGALPSHSKIGERSYWVKKINVKLNTTGNQSVLSGKKLQLLNSAEALSAKELTWLVRGTGKVTLEAGSPTTGISKIDINL